MGVLQIFKNVLQLSLGDIGSNELISAIITTSLPNLETLVKDQGGIGIDLENQINSEEFFQRHKALFTKWILGELEFVYTTYPEARRLNEDELREIGISQQTS